MVRTDNKERSGQKRGSGVRLGTMGVGATLAADRAFDVFGDHSYRMDLRG
jgi:hypothetical protein